ncbi:MAG: efflux transporter outer membrane subunit [Rubrivivax sp.]
MRRRALLIAAAGGALAGCASAPRYERPQVELPAAWAAPQPWREGRPEDAAAPKGPWWLRFDDAALDELVRRALADSPNAALAAARLAQARAVLAGASAALLPQIGLSERAARQKISANRPLTRYDSENFSTVQNDWQLAMSVSYEIDVAGRVRSSVDAAAAGAAQAAADAENLRLLLATDLATAYFNLRAVDAELDVLDRALALQRRALELVRKRYELGAATGLDLAQQQSLLDTTLVQVELLRRQRGSFEHAIATLVGVPAPGFALAADLRAAAVPVVPLGVPSDLLERRPDVAAAERAVAASNAQIGVARAAYFPSLTLGGSAGFDSRSLATLLDAPSLLWSLGLAATQLVFDGGRVRAGVAAAEAAHAAATAGYRRVVLQAVQEVQDGIDGLAALQRASAQAQTAVASARRLLQMATARYDGGATGYLEVISAQQSLLASERLATQLRGQQLLTAVFLIKALGGGWEGGAALAGAE